jgi:hypothetical protein
MKWRIVRIFYHQMKQHLTFSIITDGFGTFCGNMIKSFIKFDKSLPKSD